VIYGSPYDTITRGEHEFSVCSGAGSFYELNRGWAPDHDARGEHAPRAVEPERMPYVDDPFDIA
jgi:hypothetical protein